MVTVSDGLTAKEHTVRYLELTAVDVEADIVYGKAEPESEVYVYIYYSSAEGIWPPAA